MQPHFNKDLSLWNRLRKILRRMEVDRAVFYAITARGWRFFVGPVTLVLVAWYFSEGLQAYYFLFGSLMAAQTFIELGLQTVIINVTSHEWAKLQLDDEGRLTGDPAAYSRLISLGRFVFRWYFGVSVIFVLAVGIFGAAFLAWGSRASVADSVEQLTEPVSWMSPWIALVLVAGLTIGLQPLNAVLEGCNQVRTINHVRLMQAITGSLAVWVSIWLEAGLWATVVAAVVRLGWDAYLVFVRYGRFFQSFRKPPSGPVVVWWTEVWPLQWRLAVQGMSGYFVASFFIPVLLPYHGEIVVGQMGMTWSILVALQTASMAWVQTRRPQLGVFVSQGNRRELDRLFKRITLISLGVLTIGCLCFGAVVLLLDFVRNLQGNALELLPNVVWKIADRLSERWLSPLPTMVFILAVMLRHVPSCTANYIRAHKRDPFLVLGTMANLSIGLLVWQLGKRDGPLGGPMGVALGYLGVSALFQFPVWLWIWWRFRKEWAEEIRDE